MLNAKRVGLATFLSLLGLGLLPSAWANEAPVANAGSDQTLPADEITGVALVVLDGSASTDPDGDTLTYTWTGPFLEGSTLTGVSATGTLPAGINLITLTVDDGNGGTATDEVSITVQDITPPIISSITPSRTTLWPPNHKLTSIDLVVEATDNSDPAPVAEVISVESNEPENGIGDGNTAPDAAFDGSLGLKLRAERAGPGTGRIYTITVQVSDASGNSVTGTTTVTVPHDQRNKPKPPHGGSGGNGGGHGKK